MENRLYLCANYLLQISCWKRENLDRALTEYKGVAGLYAEPLVTDSMERPKLLTWLETKTTRGPTRNSYL